MPQNNRNYNITDGQLLEFAGMVIEFYQEDQPDFMSFDSTFTESRSDEIMAALEAAENADPDSLVITDQEAKTQSVTSNMSAARAVYMDIKYFAEKAFKSSPAIIKEFGTNRYSRMRNSQVRMIQFMLELKTTVAKYRAELLAVGASDTLLDSVGTIYSDLKDNNLNQETLKKQRTQKTADRVKHLNGLYDMLREINALAARVYREDPIKRARYQFPARVGGSQESELEAS